MSGRYQFVNRSDSRTIIVDICFFFGGFCVQQERSQMLELKNITLLRIKILVARQGGKTQCLMSLFFPRGQSREQYRMVSK